MLANCFRQQLSRVSTRSGKRLVPTSCRTFHRVTATTTHLQRLRTSIPSYTFKPLIRRFASKSSSSSRSAAEREFIFLILRLTARLLGSLTRYLADNFASLTVEQRKRLALFIGTPISLVLLWIWSEMESIPYSNRKAFRWLNTTDEITLAQQAYKELLATEGKALLDEKDPLFQLTQEIVDRLVAVCVEDGVLNPSHHYNFKLHIIKSNIPNAFVLPDGSIFVYTGLLPIAETEAGLACIIGHELSHALAHHSSEKIGILRFFMLLYEFVCGFVEEKNEPFQAKFVKFVLGTLFQLGIPLAHSRDMETEADRIGLRIASRAGYDPREGKEVWKRMIALEHRERHRHDDDKAHEDKPSNRELPVSHLMTAGTIAAKSKVTVEEKKTAAVTTATSNATSTTTATAPGLKTESPAPKQEIAIKEGNQETKIVTSSEKRSLKFSKVVEHTKTSPVAATTTTNTTAEAPVQPPAPSSVAAVTQKAENNKVVTTSTAVTKVADSKPVSTQQETPAPAVPVVPPAAASAASAAPTPPKASNTIAGMLYNSLFPTAAKQKFSNDNDEDEQAPPEENEATYDRHIEGDQTVTIPTKIMIGKRLGELLSTHPCHERRILDLEHYATECMTDFYDKVDKLRIASKAPPNSYRKILKKKQPPLMLANKQIDTESLPKKKQLQRKEEEDTKPNQPAVTPKDTIPSKKTKMDDDVEFDEYDYGFAPPVETEEQYYQRLELAQKCSSLLIGQEAIDIQNFLKKIGQDNKLWGHSH